MERLIEVRCADDPSNASPGMLTGTLLTYGERARDRAERFMHGAAQWLDGGFLVNEQHDRTRNVVRVVPYVDGNELKIATPLPNTSRGRDAAINIREGVYTGLSVEFPPQSVIARNVGGVREIRSALIVGAALVDLASYAGSTVDVRERTAGGVLLPDARFICL